MKTKAFRRLCLILSLLCIIATLLPAAQAYSTDNGDTVVYVTATGEKYHTGDCSYLKSKYKTTLLEALINGYTPCSRCNPPTYTGVVPTRPTESTEKATTGGSTHGGTSGSGSSGKYENYPWPGSVRGSNRTKSTTQLESSSTTKADASDSNTFEIIFNTFWGLVALFVFVLVPLWNGFQKSRIYKRILIKRKQKELQAQLLVLMKKYKAFTGLRAFHFPKLLNIRTKAKQEMEVLEELHYCKPNGKGYPVSKTINLYYGKYGMDFTVAQGRSCYHRPTCRYARSKEYHVLELSSLDKPCNQCKPPRPEKWMKRYVKLNKICNNADTVLSFPFPKDYAGKETSATLSAKLQKLPQRIEKLPKIKK